MPDQCTILLLSKMAALMYCGGYMTDFFGLYVDHSISCSLSLRVKGTSCWRNYKCADEERIKCSRLLSLDLNPI